MNVAELSAEQRAPLLKAATRLLKIKKAKDDLVEFTEVTMPHPSDPEDPTLSRYDAQYFHRALAAALQEVEAGRLQRLIITFPPRHGKTELSTKRFPAWFIGRNPYNHIAVCTYNQTFADDLGRAVRGIIQQPAFSQVFPGVALKKESAAADRQETVQDGALYFVGRGGSITGLRSRGRQRDDPRAALGLVQQRHHQPLHDR
jgi:hypothetical protein